MRFRILLAASAATLLVGLVPSPAGALTQSDQSTANIAATITAGSIGSRTIAALPVALTAVLGNAKISGLYSVSVAEVAVAGANPWQVTTQVSQLTDGTHTIAPNTFDITTATVTPSLPAGTDTAASGGVFSGTGALSAARTLWDNAGESTSSVYTSTHTATGTLSVTPPNGTVTGAYTGTMTVTLFT